MLISRDIRDVISPGQYDQLPANKTLVPAVPAQGSKFCAHIQSGSRVHGI